MNSRSILACTIAATFAIAPSAAGGTARVTVDGSSFDIGSRSIDGLFGSDAPLWTKSSLDDVHHALHQCGIVTDTFVTFVLAESDQGLSFLTLVDDNTVGAESAKAKYDSQLGLITSANEHNQHWVNDVQQDIQEIFDPGLGRRTAFGTFTWKSTKRGDSFAWSNLVLGDELEFAFSMDGQDFPSHPGLTENGTFQFVTWSGECWDIVHTGEFSEEGQFTFDVHVVPAPSALALGAAALVVLPGVSRRRRATSA